MSLLSVSKRKRSLRNVLLALLAVILLAISGFVIWASNPYAAMPVALESLQSDEQVQINTEPWLIFKPIGQDPEIGLIFYPGGLVEVAAYAPHLRQIAAQGYLVVATPMPLNLAVFGIQSARQVIAAFPEIRSWALAGHSLGGSMAAAYADQNPDQIRGLALWASYPAESNDLSDQEIFVASIYGSRDGLATPEQVLAARPILPEDTDWVGIEGGNHAGFGWYGEQKNDRPATIERSVQQEQVVFATITILNRMERGNE
ncbi:MAG: alpha/beta hydrolase [Anaerolineales bacterium]|nr:alpha/beta hydrolase [Anaerolineales bacterium]